MFGHARHVSSSMPVATFAFFAIAMAVACAVLAPCAWAADDAGGLQAASEAQGTASPEAQATTSYSVGDSVYYGRYYQDRVTKESVKDIIEAEAVFDENGETTLCGVKLMSMGYRDYCKKMPIRWRVIKSSGGVLTLLSEKVLDTRRFSGFQDFWGTCELRTWLNGDFMKAAFSKKQRAAILKTKNAYYKKSYDQWRLGQKGADATSTEKVYLLNIDDVEGPSSVLAKAGLTTKAKASAYVDKEQKACRWWLRGPSNWNYGNQQNCYLNENGEVEAWYQTWDRGVRPVIRVKTTAPGLSKKKPSTPKIKTSYMTKRVKVGFDADGRKASYKATYSDKYFTESAYENDSPGLGMMSALAAASTYTGKKGKSKNYSMDMLKKCGFKMFITDNGKSNSQEGFLFSKLSKKGKPIAHSGKKGHHSTKKDNDHCRVQFAYKPLPNADNVKFVVLAVFINGYTKGGYEWISNFNLGTDASHAGFTKAKDEVRALVDKKVEELQKKYSEYVQIKFWIAGHSRGAAITNMLAEDLSWGFGNDNVYAYGLATPAYSMYPGYNDNIRNYIIPGDFVPKVAPSQWSFYRNNPEADKVLPTQSKSAKKNKKTKKLFKQFEGRSYKGFTNKESNKLVKNFLAFAGDYSDYQVTRKFKKKAKDKVLSAMADYWNTTIATVRSPVLGVGYASINIAKRVIAVKKGSTRDYCQNGMAMALTEGGTADGVYKMLAYGSADKNAAKVTKTLLTEGVKTKIKINPKFNDAHTIAAYVAGVASYYGK